MRKLATIQTINRIDPIKNADSIEVATINGWKAVIGKGQFEVGETIIYCEIDSVLPIKEEFEFLRKSSYVKNEILEGFRLKTMKLRGQISQGLVLKMEVLNTYPDFCLGFHSINGVRTYNLCSDSQVMLELTKNCDVTKYLGIVKYEKPIPKELDGKIKGYIDASIKKTGEERIQNLDYSELKKYTYYEMEKLDGESFSIYTKDDEFGVLTRELDLIVPTEYSDDLPRHLKYSLKHDLESKIRKLNRNIAIQGELIGPGIKKNKYDLLELEVRLFNAFDIDKHKYLDKKELELISNEIGLKLCPVVTEKCVLPNDINDFIKYTDGRSVLNNKTYREGSVFVGQDSEGNRISFKVISNKYLLKGGE